MIIHYYEDCFNMRYCAHILGGQQFTGVHEEIEEWVKTVPGAYFDKVGGTSYINGSVFYSDVAFIHKEDLLAFKIKFSGKVA